MSKEEVEIILEKRIKISVINLFSVFIFIYLFNINIILGISYLIFLYIIYVKFGYSIGGYIVGIKTYWLEPISLRKILRRLLDIIKYDYSYLLIGVKDFYMNECAQFPYDKKFNIYLLHNKGSFKNYVKKCSFQYKFSNVYDYFFKFFIYFIIGVMIIKAIGYFLHILT